MRRIGRVDVFVQDFWNDHQYTLPWRNCRHKAIPIAVIEKGPQFPVPALKRTSIDVRLMSALRSKRTRRGRLWHKHAEQDRMRLFHVVGKTAADGGAVREACWRGTRGRPRYYNGHNERCPSSQSRPDYGGRRWPKRRPCLLP